MSVFISDKDTTKDSTYRFNSTDQGWYCDIKSKLYIATVLISKEESCFV